MRFNLPVACPALTQGIIGIVAPVLVGFAWAEAIWGGTVSGG